MRFALLLAAVCAVALASCKKKEKDNEPEPVPFDLALHHSGFWQDSLSLDTSAVTEQLLTVRNLDDLLYRQCHITVWVKGPHLGAPDTEPDTTMTFNLTLLIAYDWAELDNNGNLPPLTAARLAQAINNSNYSWNDGSEFKEMSFGFCQGGFCTAFVGGNDFDLENAAVVAESSANTVHVQGSADVISLQNPATFDEEHVTGWVFDYVFAVD